MNSYNTSAYRLSELPKSLFKEIIKYDSVNKVITVHEVITSLSYRVTLWSDDRIVTFVDINPSTWNSNNASKHEVIKKLLNYKENE